MTRILAVLVTGAVGFTSLVGCGPTCQNTCQQVYDVCNIQKPGQDRPELIRDCVNECQDALQKSGDLGDYDPRTRRSNSQSIVLENDTQAAAWMDCVWFYAPDGTPDQCADLDPTTGFCAPI